jgi:hypothetical protein
MASKATDWTVGVLGVLQAAVLSILVVAIISRFLQHQQVTEQTVLAVICVYVLFGLIFALLIFGVNGITGRQFFVQNPTPSFADFVYFSFVVLTTLGFGDLTPATDGGSDGLRPCSGSPSPWCSASSASDGTKRARWRRGARATAGAAGAAARRMTVAGAERDARPPTAPSRGQTRWRARAELARTSCTP